MLQKITVIIILFSIMISGCQGTSGYGGVEAGPLRIGMTIDSDGHVALTGGWVPKMRVGLGPIAIEAGIQQTIDLTAEKPFYLFIVYRDPTGEMFREEYEIGKKFTVVFSSKESVQQIQGNNNSVVVVVDTLEFAKLSATETPQPQPVPVDIGNPSVKIELVDGIEGVDIQFRAGGSVLLDTQAVLVYSVKDAVGDWRTLNEGVIDPNGGVPLSWYPYITDPVTGKVSIELDPGSYGFIDIQRTEYSNGYGSSMIFGRWGLRDRSTEGTNESFQIIPFKVESGKRTKITLDLGLLKILALNSDGTVNTDQSLFISCQDEGGLISSDCPSTLPLHYTLPEGYRNVYVGTGLYTVFFWTYYCDSSDPRVQMNNLSASPGTTNEVVFTVPQECISQ